MIPEKELLRVDEVAAILRVSTQTIYRRIDEGNIPAGKLAGGRRLLVKRSDLIKIIETSVSK